MKSKKNKLKSLLRKREYETEKLKEQKKEAKKLIIENAYNDTKKHEIICRSSPEEILVAMTKKFDAINLATIPPIEKGLVLSNDYGQGAFQDVFWR